MLKKKNFSIQEAFSKKELQFYKGKMHQINIESEKQLPKSSDCYRFYAIFVKLLIHLLAQKVKNIQQGKILLSKRRRGLDLQLIINAIWFVKMPQIQTENDKTLGTSGFWKFHAIFVYFSNDLVA